MGNHPQFLHQFFMAQPIPEPERRLDPYLCLEDDLGVVGSVQEIGLPDKYITPEPTPTQKQEQGSQFSRDYHQSLSWARIVGNTKILESDNRKQLKTYLDKLLDGLWERYGTDSKIYPPTSDLSMLMQVVTKLAQTVGIKKNGFADLLSAMTRVENRWPKLRLIEFADHLRDRLLKVPVCPQSVVQKAWSKYPDSEKGRKQALREVRRILAGEVKPSVQEFPWEKAFAAVSDLAFPTSAYNLKVIGQERHLCYLALMDLRRQQLEWDQEYNKAIKPSLEFIYRLLRSGDYEKLTQVFCSNAMHPDDVVGALKTMGNRERRLKSYRKAKTKSRSKRVSTGKI